MFNRPLPELPANEHNQGATNRLEGKVSMWSLLSTISFWILFQAFLTLTIFSYFHQWVAWKMWAIFLGSCFGPVIGISLVVFLMGLLGIFSTSSLVKPVFALAKFFEGCLHDLFRWNRLFRHNEAEQALLIMNEIQKSFKDTEIRFAFACVKAEFEQLVFLEKKTSFFSVDTLESRISLLFDKAINCASIVEESVLERLRILFHKELKIISENPLLPESSEHQDV